MTQFFKDRAINEQALLVYIDRNDIEEVLRCFKYLPGGQDASATSLRDKDEATVGDYNILFNVDNVMRLRVLTSKDVLIVTDEALMRGFDYRCNESGIALYIGRHLSTERARIQAFGRVGRYDEPCQRYADICLNNDLVDPNALANLSIRINDLGKKKLIKDNINIENYLKKD